MTLVSGPSVNVQVDAALDVVVREREHLMATQQGAQRFSRLAELYEREAQLWTVLFEHSRARVQWRAALAAEQYARQCARHWRRRAEGDYADQAESRGGDGK